MLREQEIEPPFSHPYAFTEEEGMYRCAGCGLELFRSDAKFESGTGWLKETVDLATEIQWLEI